MMDDTRSWDLDEDGLIVADEDLYSRDPDIQEAYDAGLIARLQGDSPSDPCFYRDLYAAWRAGYRDGEQ